ncbi:MAG: Rieske (2Fe-2S) protein [Planctomycetota bacterium]
MDPSPQTASCCPGEPAGVEDPRRRFLKRTLALALGALAYAVPALSGIVAFLNPLRQKSEAGRFIRVASLDMVPEKGPSQAVAVVADRTDAWNRFPNEPIGAVFLRRTGPNQVEALSVVCPHAGCSVEYQEAEGKFFCPCHEASFDPTGKRLDETSPSPRDLDTVQAEVRDGEVWVRFQNFRAGIAEKVEEA